MTLTEAKVLASRAEIAQPLFRGEPDKYETTFSAHHRLFQGPRFTQGQKVATAERLVWIAQTLELVLQGIPVFADPGTARAKTLPSDPEAIHEVIYGFLQHYHLPTPFIDVTSSLDAACSFCVHGSSSDMPRHARLYVIDPDRLEDCGLRATGGYETRSRRSRIQEARSIHLPHNCDFQKKAKAALPLILDVEVPESDRRDFFCPDFYDAADDPVAHEVAKLVRRCAYGDWAPGDLSLGRVNEYFAGVLDQLVAAGVSDR